MAKIVFNMNNGGSHVLSRKVYGGTGPMTREDASSQLSLATEKLRYFTSDDGTIIFTAHIASAEIVDNDYQFHSADNAQGICDCCGQTFVERTRRRPVVGYAWTSVLAEYGGAGVCPACFNLYGRIHGSLREWNVSEWVQHAHRLFERARTGPEVREAVESVRRQAPRLDAGIAAQINEDAAARVAAIERAAEQAVLSRTDAEAEATATRAAAEAKAKLRRRVAESSSVAELEEFQAYAASNSLPDVVERARERIGELRALALRESEAERLFQEADALVRQRDRTKAKEALQLLVTKFGDTSVHARAVEALKRLVLA